MVASDGGIFAFGDAAFYGSTGSLTLNEPIVGMASTPGGGGYWMVAADGGIFSFGDARFYGSASGMSPDSPIVGMASTPDGHGYWEAAADGAVYAFGDAQFAGNAPPGQPLVAISSRGAGLPAGRPERWRLHLRWREVLRFAHRSSQQADHRHVLGTSRVSHRRLGWRRLRLRQVGLLRLARREHDPKRPGWRRRHRSTASPPFQRAAWDRVNMCEEGGDWNVDGLVYSGGLGFSHTNWDEFNTFGYPADAAYATPDQQIRVAVAFATRYWGNPNAAPDQNGCSGGY